MKRLLFLLLLVPLLTVVFALQGCKEPEYMTATINSESEYFTAILIVEDGWIISLEVCDKFEGECEISDGPNHTEYERIISADYDSMESELALFLKLMDALHEELEEE